MVFVDFRGVLKVSDGVGLLRAHSINYWNNFVLQVEQQQFIFASAESKTDRDRLLFVSFVLLFGCNNVCIYCSVFKGIVSLYIEYLILLTTNCIFFVESAQNLKHENNKTRVAFSFHVVIL